MIRQNINFSTAMRLRMQGIETEKKRIAFSLLKQGIPDEIIIKATNLSKKDLDYLKTLKEYQLDLESL